MPLEDPLQNFEDFLEPGFAPLQFANDLLKVTNSGSDDDVLDLKTCMKRCSYDLQELDRRIDETIKQNPSEVIEQVVKRKKEHELVGDALKSNAEYLSMSYNRLQKDVLEPYETALKLQTVSSKMHQTTSLLRSSLIYVHMISQLQQMPLDFKSSHSDQLERGLKVAELHNQLKFNLDQNPNLSTLQLIKSCEENIVIPKRQELLGYLSTSLERECTSAPKIENNPQRIITLIRALYTLSSTGLFDTIDKILNSKSHTVSQILSKTITSIRNLDNGMVDAMQSRNLLHVLENAMKEVRTTESSNVLRDYYMQRKMKSLASQYWVRVSRNFKRDFEMSFNRGGPVGKSLQNNAKIIKSIISQAFEPISHEETYLEELNLMLNSVSILDKDRQ